MNWENQLEAECASGMDAALAAEKTQLPPVRSEPLLADHREHPHEEETMTDAELDKRLNHTHQTGISEGLRRAAEHIMQAAKDSFEHFGTKERQTERLRHLANELHCKANAAHPGTPNSSMLAELCGILSTALARRLDAKYLDCRMLLELPMTEADYMRLMTIVESNAEHHARTERT